MNDLVVSPVFIANMMAYRNAQFSIIANQGGTRSGKTYSILQLLIKEVLSNNLEISVVSKTLPHLKKGAIRDFLKILQSLDIYDDRKWNKSELVYRFTKESFIEFFSADDSAKLRGPGRDVLFVNEINLLNPDEWLQLMMRTRSKKFCDYNPVDEFSWVYDKIVPRNDCKYIQSNYLDNYDFLPKEQITEIERLQTEDDNLWQIFGLGNIAHATNLIYTKLRFETIPFPNGDTIYGIDFGFNNPTAIVRVTNLGNNMLYLEEALYERGLTNSDLLKLMPDIINNNGRGSKNDYIYADAAEPQRIKEFYDAGFNIYPADKGPNSVKARIDYCKRFNLIISDDSPNGQKEARSYKWKEDKNGIILDEPVKFNDHFLDAFGYAVFTHGQKYWDIPALILPSICTGRSSGKVLRKADKYDNY